MTITLIKTAFQAGELSPSVWGRVDKKPMQAGCSVMRNVYVSYRGTASSRAGLKFAGHSPTVAGPGSLPPVLAHFQYNVFQSYLLEFGARGDAPYMRVIVDSAYVTEDPIAASRTNPLTITAPGNAYAIGDAVSASGFLGISVLQRQIERR